MYRFNRQEDTHQLLLSAIERNNSEPVCNDCKTITNTPLGYLLGLGDSATLTEQCHGCSHFVEIRFRIGSKLPGSRAMSLYCEMHRSTREARRKHQARFYLHLWKFSKYFAKNWEEERDLKRKTTSFFFGKRAGNQRTGMIAIWEDRQMTWAWTKNHFQAKVKTNAFQEWHADILNSA